MRTEKRTRRHSPADFVVSWQACLGLRLSDVRSRFTLSHEDVPSPAMSCIVARSPLRAQEPHTPRELQHLEDGVGGSSRELQHQEDEVNRLKADNRRLASSVAELERELRQPPVGKEEKEPRHNRQRAPSKGVRHVVIGWQRVCQPHVLVFMCDLLLDVRL